MSTLRRIPGARWFWEQGRKARAAAEQEHARTVADHYDDPSREPEAPMHPREGLQAENPGGKDAPVRAN